MAVLVIIIYLSKKLSRFFNRIAAEIEIEEQKDSYCKEQLLTVINDFHDSLFIPQEKTDYTKRLLAADQELREKQSVSDAIETELGVKIYTPPD